MSLTEITSALLSRRPRAFLLRELEGFVKPFLAESSLSPRAAFEMTLEELLEAKTLRKLELLPEDPRYKPITRYTANDCTPLEIASSLKSSGFFSHATAAFLHGLTDVVPKVFYINHEQSPKPAPASPLRQSTIDNAFQRKQRLSRYIFRNDSARFVLLNGKNTKRLGVISMTGPDGSKYKVTDLERTLVDCVVRPAYSGGIVQVLESFEQAGGRLDCKRLSKTLAKLNYRYPYHQAIGFLLERAGFTTKDTKPFKDLGQEFSFYLSYGVKNPVLDRSWNLFIPKGF